MVYHMLNGTKPWPEPMLTLTWGSMNLFCNIYLEIILSKWPSHLPGSNELKVNPLQNDSHCQSWLTSTKLNFIRKIYLKMQQISLTHWDWEEITTILQTTHTPIDNRSALVQQMVFVLQVILWRKWNLFKWYHIVIWRFCCFLINVFVLPLQWCHNGCDGVSNHQPHDCLLNRLFKRRSKKTPKLHVTGLCEGNSLVTGEFPIQMASNTENVSIWWHHHGLVQAVQAAIFGWLGPVYCIT